MGFLTPRTGRVLFNGEDITGTRPDLVLRRGLAYVPQGRIVFPQMTVLENLEMGAYTERDPKRVAAAIEQVYACSRSWPSGAGRPPAPCREASSRWSRSRAR